MVSRYGTSSSIANFRQTAKRPSALRRIGKWLVYLGFIALSIPFVSYFNPTAEFDQFAAGVILFSIIVFLLTKPKKRT